MTISISKQIWAGAVASALVAASLTGPAFGEAAAPIGWYGRYSVAETLAIDRFAMCIVRSQPNSARKALAGGVLSASTSAALDLLVEKSTCLNGTKNFSFEDGVLAGALAEGLLKREGKTAHLSDVLAESAKTGRTIAHDGMEGIGVCVSQKAPGDVAALLAAAPDSAAEKAPMAAVGGALGACVPGGEQVRFNKTGLRALLAVSAYRIVNASVGS